MTDGPDQRKYWDSNLDAANLGRGDGASGESLQSEILFSAVPDIQQMLDAMQAGPGKRILEVGPGLGANAFLLAGRGATVFAVDISHERLAAMRGRLAGLSHAMKGAVIPVVARAEALPFKPGALDGAFCRAVLIHTELDAACAEVARVLQPGAPIAFSEPASGNPFVRVYRWLLAPPEWKNITTYFSPLQLAQVGRHFEGFEHRPYYFFAFLAFVFQYAVQWPTWFYAWFNRLHKLDEYLFRRFPEVRRYAWFVLMTGRKPRT